MLGFREVAFRVVEFISFWVEMNRTAIGPAGRLSGIQLAAKSVHLACISVVRE
jgi:hypothetical protein